MEKFSRLVMSVETLERGAATASRFLADELVRPTVDRDNAESMRQLGALLSSLGAAHRTVAELSRRRSALRRIRKTQILRGLEARMVQWEKVSEAVGDCLAGHEWPLMPEAPSRFDLSHAQGTLLSDAFTRAHRVFNPVAQDQAAAAAGAFADIPLDTAQFMSAVHLAYRLRLATKTARPWRFLDVGCGGGVKVALAADFFDEAVGVEIDPGYVDVARSTLRIMGAYRCEVELADALNYDGYSGFNVIYFYRPSHNSEDLIQLEQRIAEQSRKDVILIAPYRSFARHAQRLGFTQVEGPIFMRPDAGFDLDALVAEARKMGPHVMGADQNPPQGLGWLRPLWLACVANGICPS